MATIQVTKDNFNDILKGHDIVLLDFWADWCGPCRMFGPIFEKVSEKNPDIAFGKVDTDVEQELAAAFDIMSIPTLAAFREGILLYAQPGVLPEPILEDLIRQIRALDMEQVRKEVEAAQAKEQEQE